MIYYNQSPPWGQFNRFINDRCLEEIAEYIQRAIPEHIRSWGIKAITEEAAAADVKLGAIRLDHTRTLSVSGDTLYFCSNFDCWFPVGEEDIEDADGASLDVAGKILFFPPGTKKYEFALTGVYRHYQYSEEGQNHTLHFPGVSVNQSLYPAFGYNEKLRNEKLEQEAERFLAQFYPDALYSVIPVPLRQIAEEKMGLHVYTGYKLPEDMDTLGVTAFQTQKVTVTDEESGEALTWRFPRGSIVVDPDVMWERGLGSFQFTLAHEIYHWFAHRVHMAFIDIMGKPDDYEKIKGHLESQANGAGARILMPGFAVREKYREELERLSEDGSEDTDSYELAVAACAAFFYTSKTAMRKRLHELGLHEESRSPAVRRRLDIVEMFTQYIEDETFRNLLDAGIYRYLKGYVVRNDPKYIQGDSLTEYAREHLNECALTFRETYRKPEETTGGLLFRKDAYFSLRADYDERMKREPEAMARLKNRLEEMKTRYIGSLEKKESFCEYMMPIITDLNTKYMGLDIRDEVDDGLDEGKLVLKPDKRYRSRFFLHYDFQTGKTIRITEPEVFQNRTLVHLKKFEEMRRNDWNNPELGLVIAVCAGYHLDIKTTEDALLHAGYLLIQHIPKHLVYRFLITHCRDQYEDAGTFNTLLRLLGVEEVGTKKREPKEKAKADDEEPKRPEAIKEKKGTNKRAAKKPKDAAEKPAAKKTAARKTTVKKT